MNAPEKIDASVVHGMPAEDYHRIEALSAGGSKSLLKSMAHHYSTRKNPGIGQSPAMVLGSLLHSMTLEPETVPSLYVIEPSFDKRTKAGKADAEAFAVEHAGKTVVTPDQWAAAQAMQASIRAHPAAAVVLPDAKPEVSIFWQQYGVPCKARLDLLPGGYVADLKSAADASKNGFAKSCANFGYHRQAVHYMDAYRAAIGEAPAGFIFLVVESTPPYPVGAYELDAAALDLGRRQMERAAERYREYLDFLAANPFSEGRSPPARYTEQVDQIPLPAYAYYQDEQ